MRIYTLWESSDHMDVTPEMPWLVTAIDEITVDEGDPSSYQKELAKPNRRELVIDIPDSAVRHLFTPKETKGKVIETEEGSP